MKRRGAVAVAALAVLAGCVSEPTIGPDGVARGPVSYLDEGKLVRHSSVKLTKKTQGRFDEFAEKAEPYSAMYVNSNGNGSSGVYRRFSLEDAKAAARAGCEAIAGPKCVLYATVEPASPASITALPRHLYHKINKARFDVAANHSFALAVSADGSAGWGWNYKTGKAAMDAALGGCEESSENHRNRETNAKVKAAKERAGIYDCKPFAHLH